MRSELKLPLSRLVERLAAVVSPDEAAHGWMVQSKEAIRRYFQGKLVELERGGPTADFGLVRGLDAWSISGGDLYDEALRLNRELNDR